MMSNCMPHKECCHTGENITDTDFGYTLSLINGKYKLIIIYWLAQHKPVRVRQIIDPDSGIHVSMGRSAQIRSYAGQSKGVRQ